ncbi:MAG: hypothetical protein KDA24_25025 [Deltaproteobacteria bacterium]|nr:hypothetical protein [Deltaproteobacteria bacterium]
MDFLLTPTWDLAVPIAAFLGIWATVWGVATIARTGLVNPGINPNRHVFALAGGLRTLLMGLTTFGLAAGWATDDRALAGLMWVIGLEELYECTMVRMVAKRGFET